MKTRNTVLTALASAAVLGAGWTLGTAHGATTHTAQAVTNEATSSGEATKASPGSSASTAPTGAPSASGTTSTAAGASGTFTGATSANRYGSVTVTVTMTGGTISDVQAAYVADDHHSRGIVERALPTLRSAVLAAQSANIDTVGGATYTSESYLSSLQSALDQAAR